MKRLVAFLLVLLLVCPVMAQETSDLGAAVEDYMAQNGLNSQNFSMSYYNTVTGESYTYNDKKFMVAASTFKLPVNMYFYELEAAGEVASDAKLPLVGVPLDEAHKLSLVQSNNEVSIGMLYTIGDGDFQNYKGKMRKYFTMPDEEIDYLYYADNYYCTHMMMDALKYLYENRELFSEMIGYMKQAQQEEYFCAGVKDFAVAHKYGWFEGAVNDVGIIYTEEPFLLAVYTQGVLGEQVVAEIAALATRYNVEHGGREGAPEKPEVSMENGVVLPVEMVPIEKETEEVPEEEQPSAEPVFAPAEQTHEEKTFAWWMLPVALGVFLLGGGGTVLLTRKKWMQQMLQDEEREDTDEPL